MRIFLKNRRHIFLQCVHAFFFIIAEQEEMTPELTKTFVIPIEYTKVLDSTPTILRNSTIVNSEMETSTNLSTEKFFQPSQHPRNSSELQTDIMIREFSKEFICSYLFRETHLSFQNVKKFVNVFLIRHHFSVL